MCLKCLKTDLPVLAMQCIASIAIHHPHRIITGAEQSGAVRSCCTFLRVAMILDKQAFLSAFFTYLLAYLCYNSHPQLYGFHKNKPKPILCTMPRCACKIHEFPSTLRPMSKAVKSSTRFYTTSHKV